VSWSDNTRDKTLALITAKTTDAVGTFLDSGYAQRAVRAMEKDAGHPVTDPEETVRTVSQRLRFTDAQQKDILNHFIRGGDVTAAASCTRSPASPAHSTTRTLRTRWSPRRCVPWRPPPFSEPVPFRPLPHAAVGASSFLPSGGCHA